MVPQLQTSAERPPLDGLFCWSQLNTWQKWFRLFKIFAFLLSLTIFFLNEILLNLLVFFYTSNQMRLSFLPHIPTFFFFFLKLKKKTQQIGY